MYWSPNSTTSWLAAMPLAVAPVTVKLVYAGSLRPHVMPRWPWATALALRCSHRRGRRAQHLKLRSRCLHVL